MKRLRRLVFGTLLARARASVLDMKSRRGRADGHYEQQFHERLYKDDFLKGGAFEKIMFSLAPALPETSDRLVASLGKIENLRICELGCGDGGLAVKLAREGGLVSGFDISKSGVKKAILRARSGDLRSVDLLQMDACHLSFRDGSFDLVVGEEVLHHVDTRIAAREINRILKKGGRALFVEPLAHNPISNLWRKITPTYRTTSEWPLSYAEIQEMGGNFSSTTCEEFHLLTLLSSFVYLITHGIRAKWKAGEILSKAEIPLLKKFKSFSGVLRILSASVLIQFTKA